MYTVTVSENNTSIDTVKYTVEVTTDAGEDPNVFVVKESADESSGSYVEHTEFYTVASPADMREYGSSLIYGNYYRVSNLELFATSGNSSTLDDTVDELIEDITTLVENCSLNTLTLNSGVTRTYYDSGSYSQSGSFVFRERP